MQSMGLPEKVLTDINRLFYTFIWQKRFSNRKAFEKVKGVIVEGNLEDGGLKMVNVVHLQKALGWKTRKIWRREMDTHTKMGCVVFLNWQTVLGCLSSIVALKMERDFSTQNQKRLVESCRLHIFRCW